MDELNERIEIFVCNTCNGGLPPCRIEIPLADEIVEPKGCPLGNSKPNWIKVGTIPVKFDWDYSYVLKNKNGEQHG
jgi:hypothetical protein